VDNLQVPGSLYDKSSWLTLGMNYRLVPQAEVAVNYIFKKEWAHPIDAGDPSENPLLNGGDMQYTAQKNDLLLVQFQIWK